MKMGKCRVAIGGLGMMALLWACSPKGGAGALSARDGDLAGDVNGHGPRMCGNLACNGGETCLSCESDCGSCDEAVITECNDGIDNDGDGLVDWQFDVGCYSKKDRTESSGTREEEDGWTTFDLSDDSIIVYVSSSEGADENDGLSPENPVATPARGAELVRDGSPDFLLFKRGDTWRGEDIGSDRTARRFKSGLDAEHPIVIGSYGDSVERPRLEIDKPFIDHDGHERNFVAVIGLAMVSFPKDPDDPGFNGADGGALRFVGKGHDVLVEDNYVEYGEFIVQNETDIEIRRNVVYRSYHVGTCSKGPHGDPTFRPSGMFAGGNDGLLIEGNVWDENGWNPDVAEACATIYNHDLYLSGNSRLKVRDNLILRASSIGIKMSSGAEGASRDVVIENNLFAEGEIGISMGGNADTRHRFRNAVVRNNVMTDIGRSQPTGRTLTWYLDLVDNDGTVVQGNVFVNQPELGNTHGILLDGGTNRDVSITGNFFYGLGNRQIMSKVSASFSGISIEDNSFYQDRDAPCLVNHQGELSKYAFAGNAYFSNAPAGEWFCVDGRQMDLAGWRRASGESDAEEYDGSVPDAGRNLDSYAERLGIGSTLADFAASARQLSRHKYRRELTAPSACNYIREGFGLAAK